ncbi:MAG: glycoside hydrolase family 25 protein [Ethanoligenens sp.]
MKKILRPLLLSVGFYVAACGIVLRVIPGDMAHAGAVDAKGVSANTALTSPVQANSNAASVEPTKAAPAPHDAAFDIVDISHHDTITNWAALKGATSGLYTKATEGSTYVDPMLGAYSAAAEKAGLPIGFFHYFWPTNDPTDAAKQADHFYQTIQPYGYAFYPALDVEEDNNLTPAALTAAVLSFATEFEHVSGHSLLIYCSRKFADKYLTSPALAKYGLWVADYNGQKPAQAGAWKSHIMWQYTDHASIAGVPNPMDADHATASIILPGH